MGKRYQNGRPHNENAKKCWNFVDDPSLHENYIVICHLKSCQLSQCSIPWLRYTWNSAAADVVCRQLGFRKSLKSLHGLDSRVRVPRGLVTITDSVICSGDESSLSQCSVSYSSSCPMDRVVYVRKGWIQVSVSDITANNMYLIVDKGQGFIQQGGEFHLDNSIRIFISSTLFLGKSHEISNSKILSHHCSRKSRFCWPQR